MWAGDPLAVTHEEDNMGGGVPNNAPGLTAIHQKTSQSIWTAGPFLPPLSFSSRRLSPLPSLGPSLHPVISCFPSVCLLARVTVCPSVCPNISERHMRTAQSRGSAQQCPRADTDLTGHPHMSVAPCSSLWTVYCRSSTWVKGLVLGSHCWPTQNFNGKNAVSCPCKMKITLCQSAKILGLNQQWKCSRAVY